MEGERSCKGLGPWVSDHLIPVGSCLRQDVAASKHHFPLKKKNKICCSKTCLPSFLLCIINYFVTTPKVWPPWIHTDYGTQVGYKCGFEIAMTSTDLSDKYAAVLVERHKTVRNDVLKITVATVSYKHQLKILAEGKSLGPEAAEVQQPARTQYVLDTYIYNESIWAC